MDRLFITILLSLVMTTILTVNSQGLRSPDRRKMAFSNFLRNRSDKILLQETHWTIDMEMEIKREWIGDVFFNHGTNNARGVAILIHSRLECNVSQIRSDNEGRILNIVLELDDHTLNIVNIYMHLKRTAIDELSLIVWMVSYPRIWITS